MDINSGAVQNTRMNDTGTTISSLIDEDSEPPKTRAEAAYRRFRRDILWGKLPPGMPLRSDELRRNYDIGISPLREALSRLVSERLVTSSGQRGFRVAPVTARDVLDTMETRIVLECEALSRSIQSGGLEWETQVVGSFHTLTRLPPPEEPGEQAEKWSAYHRRFHLALLAGCGSDWLISLARSLFDHAERHRVIALKDMVDSRDAVAEHRQIMEAALDGKVKAAVSALDHHYRSTADCVVKCIAQNRQEAATT